jgi:hypothetical protein
MPNPPAEPKSSPPNPQLDLAVLTAVVLVAAVVLNLVGFAERDIALLLLAILATRPTHTGDNK